LLKFKEEKYKGSMVWPRWSLLAKRELFLLGTFKPTVTPEKGRTRRFPSNNQEWGGAGVVLAR
jgi:hypothetical protein